MRLIYKWLDGTQNGGASSNDGNNNNGLSAAKSGFMQSGGYKAAIQTAGSAMDLIKTPNSDLNSNNKMAGLIREEASNALLASGNPYAMAAGAAIKIMDKTGGFTDASKGLGKKDDALNMVAALAIPGAGWFTKKTEKYQISGEMKSMADGYAGAMEKNNTAAQNAGAKILFGRNKATSMIHTAKTRDNMVSSIREKALDDYNTMASMSLNKAMEDEYAYQGGYNQALARAAKFGMKIEKCRAFNRKIKTFKMKEGGSFDFHTQDDYFIPTTQQDDNKFFLKAAYDESYGYPDSILNDLEFMSFIRSLSDKAPNQQPYTKDYNTYRAWQLNGRPKNFEEALQKGMYTFVPLDNTYHANSAYINLETGNYEFMKGPNHPTRYMELDWYDKGPSKEEYVDKYGNFSEKDFNTAYNDWINFRRNYYFKEQEGDNPAMYIHAPGKTGMLKQVVVTPNETYVQEDAQYYKLGGQMNVIPEGSLHARLHHMENGDKITKKGIPVIDNDGNQLAEIELNEIIFNYEVSTKLEELLKKYNSEDTKKSEKDQIAIEAGKLLTEEIIEHTDDRTGLIEEI